MLADRRSFVLTRQTEAVNQLLFYFQEILYCRVKRLYYREQLHCRKNACNTGINTCIAGLKTELSGATALPEKHL
jgi:hypothetical protein